MQMLGNIGAKQNLYFIPPLWLKIVPALLRGTDYLSTLRTNSAFLKEMEYCSQHNMLH